MAPTTKGVTHARDPRRGARRSAGGLRPLRARPLDRAAQPVGLPWATFTVNVTGCLLIGVITEALVDRHHLPAWIRVDLVLGLIGGYTTFSTYAQEALTLFYAPDGTVALAYTVGSVVTGILA